MNTKTFILAASIIFMMVAVLQLARVILGWEVTVDHWHVPVWASVVAVLVAGLMSFAGFRALQQIQKHLT